jgi:hypothetical protein
MSHVPKTMAIAKVELLTVQEAAAMLKNRQKNKRFKGWCKTPSADHIGLNFRVPEAFAWAFKQAALSAKMKQNEFLYYLLEKHREVDK